MAVIFNLGNAYLNGRYLFHFAVPRYSTGWLLDPALSQVQSCSWLASASTAGRIIPCGGCVSPRETGYKIPQGGLYRYISCPNYIGEIVEWFGWALATRFCRGWLLRYGPSPTWLRRAWSHHRWYHEQFSDYPLERKALIPGIW